MSTPNRQHIFIFDHPESKIRFLETTLDDQDWMATIVIAPQQAADPASYANQLEAEFREKGFSTSQSTEAGGTVNLTIHHMNRDTSPVDVFHEMGFAKGTAFSIAHTGENLGKLVDSTSHLIAYLVREPARLFSTIYLLGDSAYSLSGWFSAKNNKVGKAPKVNFGDRVKDIIQPENALMSLSGLLAFVQSIIFIKFANNGGELNYDELKNKFKSGEHAGIDGMNVKGWTAPDMNSRWFGAFGEMARKYPIDTGAWTQIAGQVALGSASAIGLNKNFASLKGANIKECWNALRTKDATGSIAQRKDALGSSINIMRTGAAIGAWLMLMRPASDQKVTADWAHPITRMQQEIDAHPERAAGLINFVASIIGLTASHIKGNHAAIAAESMWLAGDVVMMFAQKSHYGSQAASKELPLIDATTRFMKEMPVAVSATRQNTMVNDLALYLAQKTIDDQVKPSESRKQSMNAEIESLKQAIVAGVTANLSRTNHIFDRMAAASGILVERFPPEKRMAIIQRLAHGIAACPGVYATQEEITDAINAVVDLKSGFGSDAPNMSVIARDVAQLIIASPPIANAGIATAIYDAVTPVMKQNPHDDVVLHRAMDAAMAQQNSQGEGVHAARSQQSMAAHAISLT